MKYTRATRYTIKFKVFESMYVVFECIIVGEGEGKGRQGRLEGKEGRLEGQPSGEKGSRMHGL